MIESAAAYFYVVIQTQLLFHATVCISGDLFDSYDTELPLQIKM